MKTILIGILFWMLIMVAGGCSTVKEIGGDLSHIFKAESWTKQLHPMTPRVENGRELSTEEAAWDRDRLLYASGQKSLSELNERINWGHSLIDGGTAPYDIWDYRNRYLSFEERIASPNTIIRNTSGAFYPIGGFGYYRYGGCLYKIPPRNTAEYDWYLRRKAWGDFK